MNALFFLCLWSITLFWKSKAECPETGGKLTQLLICKEMYSDKINDLNDQPKLRETDIRKLQNTPLQVKDFSDVKNIDVIINCLKTANSLTMFFVDHELSEVSYGYEKELPDLGKAILKLKNLNDKLLSECKDVLGEDEVTAVQTISSLLSILLEYDSDLLTKNDVDNLFKVGTRAGEDPNQFQTEDRSGNLLSSGVLDKAVHLLSSYYGSQKHGISPGELKFMGK